MSASVCVCVCVCVCVYLVGNQEAYFPPQGDAETQVGFCSPY